MLRFIKPADRADIRAGKYNREGTTAILLNEAGQILLQLRDDIPGICYPGHWCTPGGGLEPGETAEDAMRRELREEIGYCVGELEPYGQIIDRYGNRDLINLFVARIERPVEELILGEGQAIAYFDKEALPHLKISPHLKEVVLHYFFGTTNPQ